MILDDEKEASLEDPSSAVQGFQKEGADDDTDKFVQALDEADTQVAILEDQHRMISATGTTNREQAEAYKDQLPEGFALESFTTFPTRTNVAIALEALNTGIKFMLAAGLLAILGTAILLATRARGRSISSAREQKMTQEMNKMLDSWDTELSKLEGLGAMDEAQERTYEQVRAETYAGSNHLTMHILAGKHTAMADVVAGGAGKRAAYELSKWIKENVLEPAHALARKGKDATLEDIKEPSSLPGTSPQEWVSRWAKANQHVKGSDAAIVMTSFRRDMLSTATTAEVEQAVKASLTAKDGSITAGANLDDIATAQKIIGDLADDLQKCSKELEGSKELPKEVQHALRHNLEKAKDHLTGFDDVFFITEQEGKAFRVIANGIGKQISNGFRMLLEGLSAKVEASGRRTSDLQPIKADMQKAHAAMKEGNSDEFVRELRAMSYKAAKHAASLKEANDILREGLNKTKGDGVHEDLPDDVKEMMRRLRSKDDDGPINI